MRPKGVSWDRPEPQTWHLPANLTCNLSAAGHQFTWCHSIGNIRTVGKEFIEGARRYCGYMNVATSESLYTPGSLRPAETMRSYSRKTAAHNWKERRDSNVNRLQYQMTVFGLFASGIRS